MKGGRRIVSRVFEQTANDSAPKVLIKVPFEMPTSLECALDSSTLSAERSNILIYETVVRIVRGVYIDNPRMAQSHGGWTPLRLQRRRSFDRPRNIGPSNTVSVLDEGQVGTCAT